MLVLFRRMRMVAGRFLVVAWAVALTALCGALLAFHVIALPAPPLGDPQMAAAIHASRSESERGRWLLVHVLYARCTCSKRILDHLRHDPRPPDVAERMIIVDDVAPDVPGGPIDGFATLALTPAELQARYHIEAAPLLVVVSPSGEVRYAGGYTSTKQAAYIQDVDVVARARDGGIVASLPLFGCAVSDALRRVIDPWGLKQW